METQRVIVLPGWLTAAEAASRLGRSIEAFRKLAAYHNIAPAHIGHTAMYSESDIRRLADRATGRA